jgi:hypothetical protein
LWRGVFLGIATLILVIRKHEVPLLSIYRIQSTWLRVNRAKIEDMPEHLTPSDSWA